MTPAQIFMGDTGAFNLGLSVFHTLPLSL
ncbi:MAG: hypothetical protein IPP49_07005 [Saprospiraceae bacterium]|nr:hypothetical protein [Saprospiraceae bacterium]